MDVENELSEIRKKKVLLSSASAKEDERDWAVSKNPTEAKDTKAMPTRETTASSTATSCRDRIPCLRKQNDGTVTVIPEAASFAFKSPIHRVDMGRYWTCKRHIKLVMGTEMPDVCQEVDVDRDGWNNLVENINEVLDEKFKREVFMRKTHATGILQCLVALALCAAFLFYVNFVLQDYPDVATATTVFGGTMAVLILAMLHIAFTFTQEQEISEEKQRIQKVLDDFIKPYDELKTGKLTIEEPTTTRPYFEWYIWFSTEEDEDEAGGGGPGGLGSSLSRLRHATSPSSGTL